MYVYMYVCMYVFLCIKSVSAIKAVLGDHNLFYQHNRRNTNETNETFTAKSIMENIIIKLTHG